MAEVNEEIARVYFEEFGYVVRTNLYFKKKSGGGTGPSDIDLLIVKPYGKGKYGKKAIVSVKGWHSFTFTLDRLKKSKRIYDMFGPQYTKQAVKFFGKGFNKIFIVPKLPKDKKEVGLIRKYVTDKKGIDHILDFPEILNELIKKVDKKRNYGNSEVLQTIRVLKNYNFLNVKDK